MMAEQTKVLLNPCKDISLTGNIGKTKYMEVGRRRDMMAHEHIAVDAYQKVPLNIKALYD